MFKAGLLKPAHVIFSVLGTVLMGFVIFSSVSPWPSAPDQYLPQIFIGYIAVGLAYFVYLKFKSPQVLLSIAGDMEG
jgi:hypothetical protein